MKNRTRGYIFVETLVAMAILSVSAIVIQESIRQAILARAQAMDYTTARFLLEKVMADRMLSNSLTNASRYLSMCRTKSRAKVRSSMAQIIHVRPPPASPDPLSPAPCGRRLTT